MDKLILTGSSGLYENAMFGGYPKRGNYNYPPQVALDFNQHLHQATLRMVPQCGHVPMMERPVEFNRVLEAFLHTQHAPSAPDAI